MFFAFLGMWLYMGCTIHILCFLSCRDNICIIFPNTILPLFCIPFEMDLLVAGNSAPGTSRGQCHDFRRNGGPKTTNRFAPNYHDS